VAWWLLHQVSRAQEKARHVGILINATAEEPEAQSYVVAFQQGMQEAGWSIGRSLRVDLRWAGATPTSRAGTRQSWAALAPDVLVGAGVPLALQRATRAVPIVFSHPLISWPELQIRITQLAREGSPPPGLRLPRPSCHVIPIR
jgi:hypothetical protein